MKDKEDKRKKAFELSDLSRSSKRKYQIIGTGDGCARSIIR